MPSISDGSCFASCVKKLMPLHRRTRSYEQEFDWSIERCSEPWLWEPYVAGPIWPARRTAAVFSLVPVCDRHTTRVLRVDEAGLLACRCPSRVLECQARGREPLR